ncbi:MAG: cysteine synthase CysM [Flavobacteriales bacterium]|nr:cysteine synthase CysM [Flavobacteriales bacterium]
MSLESLIGNTPLLELTNWNVNKRVKLFAKLEGQNPGGSVKDRAALGMITGALERGEVKKGDTLIEATSGNTGIALAMIANLKGLNMILVMPDNSTAERIQTMRAYGAEVILTPAKGTIEYSREYAEESAAKNGYHILNQFANDDNWGMHYRTTGPEIYKDTNGQITHFVSAMGTTGTIMGVSRFLKEQNNDIKIVGTQPKDGDSIPGIRRWSKEFLPKIYDPNRVDRIIDVSQSDSTINTHELARKEGVLAGMSSGGAYTAAKQIVSELDEGVVVFIVCDIGDRYLSSGLFE